MQALDADTTDVCSVYYHYSEHARSTEHAVALAILISLVLRRLHQQLVSEATFDLPDVLQAVPAFRWSQKCSKTHAVSSNSFAYFFTP